MWTVEAYERPSGRCPVNEWIALQDGKTKESIFARFRQLKNEDCQNLINITILVIIRDKHGKPAFPGFYELRHRTYKWRMAVFYDKGKNTIVLLHGWGKESKGQNAEIEKASTLLREYISRRTNHE
jgi:putative component of toxin-antitoxin plasmid stabilization module